LQISATQTFVAFKKLYHSLHLTGNGIFLLLCSPWTATTNDKKCLCCIMQYMCFPWQQNATDHTGRARVTCAAAMCDRFLFSGHTFYLCILVNGWTANFFGDARDCGWCQDIKMLPNLKD
jgi:hypothetical protein